MWLSALTTSSGQHLFHSSCVIRDWRLKLTFALYLNKWSIKLWCHLNGEIFKDSVSVFHFEFNFVMLFVAQTLPHREQTFCWRGQVQENFWVKASAESCLVLIRLKQAPAHAHSWAHFKAQQHHVGSLSPFLGHHLQKFAICWYPSTWSVLFQPKGLYSASWDWTFPRVWGYSHFHCYALWALRVQAG